ncbi:MAG: hypothetical protein QNJ78_01630 [Gammaproteobacteria bacterium]|nr:hypothetical protein [Gammaproteobacteria bacterium]
MDDDLTTPATVDAHVRVVLASTDVLRVDVLVDDSPLLTNVSFKGILAIYQLRLAHATSR